MKYGARVRSRHEWILGLVLAFAGCGSVGAADDADAESPPDSGPEGPERCNGIDDDGDGQIDEGWAYRFFDGFEGDALDPLWDTDAVHFPPTMEVADGGLTLTDAATAPTPSMPPLDAGASWIYDVDKDLGNQMAQPVPVAEGAFELDAEMFWDSQQGDMSMAGIGLTGPMRFIDLFVGLYDPTVKPLADGTTTKLIVRKPGPTKDREENFFPGFEKKRVRVHARRNQGIVTVTVTTLSDESDFDGEVVTKTFSESMPQEIVDLVIVSVKIGNDAIPFGTFGLRHVALCSNPAP